MMLLAERMQASPDGETVSVSPTVPVKPFSGATVIVEVADTPAVVVTVVGLAVTEKSWKANTTVPEFTVEPLVPVTVTANVPAVGEEQDSVTANVGGMETPVFEKVHDRPEGELVSES